MLDGYADLPTLREWDWRKTLLVLPCTNIICLSLVSFDTAIAELLLPCVLVCVNMLVYLWMFLIVDIINVALINFVSGSVELPFDASSR